MTHPPVALRTILIYVICLPLAILLGYMLSNPLSWGSFGTVGAVLFILLSPLLLRFHHPLLVLGWNFTMVIFFLPGAPMIWLPLTALSLGISIVRRSVDQQFRFISVPAVARPLIALAIIVFITAEATGGIKLRSFGGEVYGGKRYFFLLGAIAGYFALTAQQVPRRRAGLYVTLFLLGGITSLMGDLIYFRSSSLQFFYWLFPPSGYLWRESSSGLVRFGGVDVACSVLYSYMMARYGIRGIFSFRQPWRLFFFAVFVAGSTLGGFRSSLFMIVLVFAMQFYLEGLHRTRLLPVLLMGLILVASVVVPFARQLPYSVQRTLSFLPIPIDPVARQDAEGSTEWRMNIWRAVLPQVPRYLLFGKGLALKPEDYDFAMSNYTGSLGAFTEDQSWAALAGDYHNGPLSVVIPFGIWGAAAFIWFLVGGCRVLYRNYKYGDPGLRVANAFLLATFISRIVFFFLIFGSLYSDMQALVGYLGLGISLNGGVARPAPQSVPEAASAPEVVRSLPQPRTAFGQFS